MLHRVKRKLAALVKGNTPDAVLTKPASSWQGSAVWEDMISLKSQEETDFEVLGNFTQMLNHICGSTLRLNKGLKRFTASN